MSSDCLKSNAFSFQHINISWVKWWDIKWKPNLLECSIKLKVSIFFRDNSRMRTEIVYQYTVCSGFPEKYQNIPMRQLLSFCCMKFVFHERFFEVWEEEELNLANRLILAQFLDTNSFWRRSDGFKAPTRHIFLLFIAR